MKFLAVALPLLLLLAGCAAPKTPTNNDAPTAITPGDPLELGTFAVATALYDFGPVIVTDPELVLYRYPVFMTGSVHYPASGDGPLPLVLLMHGRHGTCAILGIEGIGTHVCPNAVVIEPVNSFAGYAGLAGNLASHGYVVASINANQINDRDLLGDSGANARAELVLNTIAALHNVHRDGSNGLPDLQGRIDLERIGLMGHSRGGEGVMRATTMNEQAGGAFGIQAVFTLAPTDFARWALANQTAFATLLPYCDGDVYNLQGAWMYDDAREAIAAGRVTLAPGQLLAQVVALGANHNFYNTVWTGDDNGGSQDPWCGADVSGNGRDAPDVQRAHGDAVMASFLRLFVGGEEEFRPYWTGEHSWPDALCPGWDRCSERLLMSAFVPERVLLSLDGSGGEPVYGLKAAACTPPQCPGDPTYTVADQTALDGPAGGGLLFRTDRIAPTADSRWLTLRAGVPVAARDVTLEAVFSTPTVDYPVTVPAHTALAAPPGEGEAKTLLNEVRIPFPAGLDPADLDAVYVVFAGPGKLQIADVAFS